MKAFFHVIAIFVIAIMLPVAAGEGRSNAHKKYGIYLVEEEKTQWLLLRVNANLYFMHLTPRPPKSGDHKVADRIDYSCNHFEIQREEPGYIKADGCGAFAAGWLVADSSILPPRIMIDPNTPKNSKWIIPYGDKAGYHVGTVDGHGKKWWLSMGEPAVVDVMPSGQSVYEFRPAVLSATKKYQFRFSEIEKS